MSAVSKVLVVGGGIGGLTASVALRQRGIDVDLVEINPNFTVYGVGIIQPNNTLRALDKIGLAQACVDIGCAFAGWRVCDKDGNRLMDAPSESRAAPGFPPNNGITRRGFQKVLTEAAAAHGADIKLGVKVETLNDQGGHVDVSFSDGTNGRYDFVIGCDGVYSDTRRRLFGDAVKPEFTGQAVWRYNFPRPPGLDWGEIHAGPTSKAGLVPIGPELMYIFLVTAEPGNPRMPRDQLAALLRDRLSAYGGTVAKLREQVVDPDAVVYKPMETIMLPGPWHKGRVIIIGDAAHTTTPHLAQGAAMAIEDAVLLAELLGRDAPLGASLDEFMARRFDRAKFVVDTSDQLAAWEMEAWDGTENPDAHPGLLLHQATAALLDDY